MLKDLQGFWRRVSVGCSLTLSWREVMLVPLVPAVPAVKCPQFGGTHGWVLPMPSHAVGWHVQWLLHQSPLLLGRVSHSTVYFLLLRSRFALPQAALSSSHYRFTGCSAYCRYSVPTRNHCLPSWWAAQVFRTAASSRKITPLADLVVSKLFLIFSIIHTEQNIAFSVQPHGCQMERDHCMCCWVSQMPPSFFLCATLP